MRNSPWIAITLLLIVACPTALADSSQDKEMECSRIARMRLMLIGPKQPELSFKKMIEKGSCSSDDAQTNVQANIEIGNLEQVNPKGIIATLKHTPEQGAPAEPLFTAETEIPDACKTTIETYPECVAGITSAFDEDKLRISAAALKNQRLISVGEGEAGLVESLIDNGVDAYGVDFDENYKSKNLPFTQKNQSHYQWGNALELSKHPFSKNPPDYIVSFCMLCQLDDAASTKALIEAAKAVKPGGEVRYSTFIHGIFPEDPKAIAKIVRNAVTTLRRQGIQTEVYLARLNYKFPGQTDPRPAEFILLKRLAPGQKPQNVQKTCSAPDPILTEP